MIDFELIKKKLKTLKQQNNKFNTTWKAKEGSYIVRLIPTEKELFREVYVYYFLGNEIAPGGIIAPGQSFGKPDPIQDFQRQLFEDGTDESKQLAKTMNPKLRAYVPIIVRGEEDQGVRWWSFSKSVYERLMELCFHPEIEDITDVKKGHDLAVEVKPQPNGYAKTTIDPKFSPSVLSASASKVEEWLKNSPKFEDIIEIKTHDEIESLLTRWLNSQTSSSNENSDDDDSNGDRTSNKSNKSVKDLDEMFENLYDKADDK